MGDSSYLYKQGHVKYPNLISKDDITVEAVCLFGDVDSAIAACQSAHIEYASVTDETRKKIVQRIRDVSVSLAEDFALWAISETGRGNYADKVIKQKLSAQKTPGPEDLVPQMVSGDDGMTMTTYSPYGVIGAVTPVTNPTATVINNAIIMASSGNGLIINAHPAAANCTNRVIAIMDQVIADNGGPHNLICGIRNPTQETSRTLLNHPKTAANLVTGGPTIVKMALRSGKKSFCAGPGNPPVVVDSTADIPISARAIYEGASFDNNMICSDEKEVFVLGDVADQLIEEMMKCGAIKLTPAQISELEGSVFKSEDQATKEKLVEPSLVGQAPRRIMEKIGIDIDESCRLLICDVAEDHPFVSAELLMPILPIVRCSDFDEAVRRAVVAERGLRHTASVYSRDVNHITRLGKIINTSIFCINGNHLAGLGAGGEGHTAFSITGFTGEGMTRPRTFVRERRFVIVGSLNF